MRVPDLTTTLAIGDLNLGEKNTSTSSLSAASVGGYQSDSSSSLFADVMTSELDGDGAVSNKPQAVNHNDLPNQTVNPTETNPNLELELAPKIESLLGSLHDLNLEERIKDHPEVNEDLSEGTEKDDSLEFPKVATPIISMAPNNPGSEFLDINVPKMVVADSVGNIDDTSGNDGKRINDNASASPVLHYEIGSDSDNDLSSISRLEEKVPAAPLVAGRKKFQVEENVGVFDQALYAGQQEGSLGSDLEQDLGMSGESRSESVSPSSNEDPRMFYSERRFSETILSSDTPPVGEAQYGNPSLVVNDTDSSDDDLSVVGVDDLNINSVLGIDSLEQNNSIDSLSRAQSVIFNPQIMEGTLQERSTNVVLEAKNFSIDVAIDDPQWTTSLSNIVTKQMYPSKIQYASIALNPTELGPINLEFILDANNEATINFDVLNSETRKLLEQNFNTISNQIETESNFRGVNLQFGSFDEGQNRQEKVYRELGKQSRSVDLVSTSPALPTRPRSQNGGKIDVVV